METTEIHAHYNLSTENIFTTFVNLGYNGDRDDRAHITR